MSQTCDPREILRQVGSAPDDRFDLAEAALALAALDLSNASRDPYRKHLRALAEDVAAACPAGAGLENRCAALRDVIHSSYGYEGDSATYDDLQNANLMQVIDRRKGLPVALGILYLHAARRCGWEIAGLSFPGHFLLRLDYDGERSIIDPFHEGRVCDAGDMRELLKVMQGADAELTPAHYRAVSDREVLLRLQNNVKLRLIQLNQPARAAAIVEDMLLFAPTLLALWREAGMIHAHAGNLQHAITAFETYLDHETNDVARREVAGYLRQIRSRLN